MKAAFMEGPEQFTIRECECPVPGPDEVIVKVHACAVCGSDLTMYKLGMPDRILGHEFSGEITETGMDVKDWKPGDRVTVEPQLICGECHWCKTGQYNLCDSLQYTGLATNGGFAEYAAIPAYQLHRLPDNVSYEHGAVTEPLAVALRGVQRAGVKPGDIVAVFGCGAIGLFAMLWARKLGAGKIIAVDVSQERLMVAASIADAVIDASDKDVTDEIPEMTTGLGVDVVLECSGNSDAQMNAVDVTRKGGTIMLLGIGYEAVEIPLMQITMKEIDIRGSLGYLSLAADGEFSLAIDAVSNAEIDLSRIPFGRYGIDDVGTAFADSAHAVTPKAIVTW